MTTETRGSADFTTLAKATEPLVGEGDGAGTCAGGRKLHHSHVTIDASTERGLYEIPSYTLHHLSLSLQIGLQQHQPQINR